MLNSSAAPGIGSYSMHMCNRAIPESVICDLETKIGLYGSVSLDQQIKQAAHVVLHLGCNPFCGSVSQVH
eukprot:6473301-Amphidinium_carterae.1